VLDGACVHACSHANRAQDMCLLLLRVPCSIHCLSRQQPAYLQYNVDAQSDGMLQAAVYVGTLSLQMLAVHECLTSGWAAAAASCSTSCCTSSVACCSSLVVLPMLLLQAGLCLLLLLCCGAQGTPCLAQLHLQALMCVPTAGSTSEYAYTTAQHAYHCLDGR
jgi:hypothetical protein